MQQGRPPPQTLGPQLPSSAAVPKELFWQRDENRPVHFYSYSHKFTGQEKTVLMGEHLVPSNSKTRNERTGDAT